MKFQLKFELPEMPDHMRLYIATEKKKSQLVDSDYDELNKIFLSVKSFDGVFFTTEYDDLPDENDNLTIIYSFRIVNKSLLKYFYKNKEKIFENPNNIRNEIMIPYQYWSVSSLKDELKRRNVDPKSYKNITDKDDLVSLITSLDKKKPKRVSKKKVKEKQKKQAAKNKVKEEIEETDSLAKLTVTKLKSLAKEKGFPHAMIKGKKKIDLIDMISHADETEKKVGERVTKQKSKKKTIRKKSSTTTKAKSNKTRSQRTGESFLDKKIRLAREAGDDLKVERLLRKKARKQQREKNINPKLKEQIKEFNKEHRGKKVNWNNKLKKAGIWETGMQFLTNYEKSLFLAAKSQPKKLKKMLNDFKKKSNAVNEAISDSMKKRHQSKKKHVAENSITKTKRKRK